MSTQSKRLTEQPPDYGRRPSLFQRLRAVSRGVFRFFLPQVTLPNHCRHCWSNLILAGEQLEEYEGRYVVRHTQYWECPECEDRFTERCVYMQELDVWEHS